MKKSKLFWSRKRSNESKAWNSSDKVFEFTVVIKQPMKWIENSANFGAVFSGSNDRGAVQDQKLIVEQIKAVSRYQPITLMSVVGGCFFMDLALEIPTSRIILFDSNIAEFTKLSTLLNIMQEDPSNNPFRKMEKIFREDAQFLMPNSPLGRVTWKFDPNVSKWNFEGREELPFPFILTSDLFPEYIFDITTSQAKKLVEVLKENLDLDVHLGFPRIDVKGDLVVVFCSNANPEELSLEFLKSNILNSAGIIPIRAERYGLEVLNNQEALDPHLYWEIVAKSCLVGTSHQIWPPEDRDLLGTSFDTTTNTSSVLEENTFIPEGVHSLLLHIVFGKSLKSSEQREILFESLIDGLNPDIKRIVIADWPPEVGLSKFSRFESTGEFLDYCKRTLSEFRFVESRYAPGAGNLQRNMFLIFERSQIVENVDSLSEAT
jgi:hypothetical protein